MRQALILSVAIISLAFAGCSTPSVGRADSPGPPAANSRNASPLRGNAALKVPGSIQEEHRELHEMLEKVMGLGGKTGEAAKTVEQRLSEHFVKEEEYALPQLGLLRELAAGGDAADPQRAIELSDKLKASLPQMLEEHKAVVDALNILKRDAEAEKKTAGVDFSNKLKAHAENEEEVMYPAAILAGEFIKLKKRS